MDDISVNAVLRNYLLSFVWVKKGKCCGVAIIEAKLGAVLYV